LYQGFPGTNTPAYFVAVLMTKKKVLEHKQPGVKIMSFSKLYIRKTFYELLTIIFAEPLYLLKA
jgi:hypothetical protein